jgi:5-methylcytosine-specific restriction protein A
MTLRVTNRIMSSENKPYEYIETVDPAHVRREREKAREMRASSWWKQQIGKGVCYHCEKKYSREQLTMDHLIPLSRGGRSTKKNIVVACKECNSHKKNLTVAEIRLSELKK